MSRVRVGFAYNEISTCEWTSASGGRVLMFIQKEKKAQFSFMFSLETKSLTKKKESLDEN